MLEDESDCLGKDWKKTAAMEREKKKEKRKIVSRKGASNFKGEIAEKREREEIKLAGNRLREKRGFLLGNSMSVHIIRHGV